MRLIIFMNNTCRQSIFIFALIFPCLLCSAQDISGVWKGALHVQGKELPIVFHIGKKSTGELIASFDSPAQNAFDLTVSEVITKQDSVILMIAILNGKYAGILSQDKKIIDGNWFQSKLSFPLTVTKTSDTATVKQPLLP